MKGFKKIKIKSKTIEDSLLSYIKSLTFVHGITANKDQKTLAFLMKKYIDISKDVSNEEYINTLLFSTSINKEIMDKAKMSKYEYSMFLKRLKDKGLMTENTLKKNLIPKVMNDSIGLVLQFENIDDV